MDGRDFALPDDVKAVAPATLSHRLIGRSWAESGTNAGHDLVIELLRVTPVPGNGLIRTRPTADMAKRG
jgi:MoxR-like ATPase